LTLPAKSAALESGSGLPHTHSYCERDRGSVNKEYRISDTSRPPRLLGVIVGCFLSIFQAHSAKADAVACHIVSKSVGFASFMRSEGSTQEQALELLLVAFTESYYQNAEVFVGAAVDQVYKLPDNLFASLLPIDKRRIDSLERQAFQGCMLNEDQG
jgi:hypothetical protein